MLLLTSSSRLKCPLFSDRGGGAQPRAKDFLQLQSEQKQQSQCKLLSRVIFTRDKPWPVEHYA